MDSSTTLPALPLDPAALAARFAAAGTAAGFRMQVFGEIGGMPLLALTKRTPGPRPRIYVSAGIHGDEPASPLSLLRMIEAGIFDQGAIWFLCPLLNPAGTARGERTNLDGIDLNRDYKNPRSAEARAHIAWLRRQPNFDLTLCLHEDWEAKGFYLYERNSGRIPVMAETIIAAAGQICPIDPSEQIDGCEARGGILRPGDDLFQREQWPESIYLMASHHSGIHCTLETPSGFPLEQRLATLRAAAEAAIDRLIRGN